MLQNIKKIFTPVVILVAVVGVLGLTIAYSHQGLIKEYQSSTIKDLMVEARGQAQTYFLRQNPPSYTASTMLAPSLPCTGDMFDGNFANNLESITGNASAWPKSTTLSCQATAGAFAISASLPVGEGRDKTLEIWCVDSRGKSAWVSEHLLAGDTTCN